MKIKVSPPYKPLVQMPFCCGPCSFLWVLHRRGYWIDQEEIAWKCKLRIPKENAGSFVRKFELAETDGDVGTSVEETHIYLNDLVKERVIPLVIERYLVSGVKNPEELVAENMKAGNDIMIDFSCKPFPEYGIIHGHVCVIAEFDTEKKTITLGDPFRKMPKFREVSLRRLIDAMDKEYDGHERGLWIVKPANG